MDVAELQSKSSGGVLASENSSYARRDLATGASVAAVDAAVADVVPTDAGQSLDPRPPSAVDVSPTAVSPPDASGAPVDEDQSETLMMTGAADGAHRAPSEAPVIAAPVQERSQSREVATQSLGAELATQEIQVGAELANHQTQVGPSIEGSRMDELDPSRASEDITVQSLQTTNPDQGYLVQHDLAAHTVSQAVESSSFEVEAWSHGTGLIITRPQIFTDLSK